MKNRARSIGLIALLFVVAAFLFWPTKRVEPLKENDEATTQSPNAPGLLVVPPPTGGSTISQPDPLLALMQTPIEFYGVVLDQNGSPVPSAKISASVLDNMLKGSPISTITDASGRFTIKSKGRSLHVEVSKSGYYYVDKGGALKPSSQGFDFGLDDGRGVYQPNPAAPTMFHLRKAGNPVQLELLQAQSKIPRDGRPVAVGLSKTSKVIAKIGCLTVEDNTQPPNAPYDWRCEIAIESGGIQEAIDEHIFTAPDGGYAPFAVIDMPKTLDAKRWSSRANKNYWLRFSDNTFGKISFIMIAGGDHFAVINGFRNPSPNDRNLEPKLDAR